MILVLQRISWLGIRRDPIILALTFALPIAFFSIFAVMFGSVSKENGVRAIRIGIVDEDRSELSRQFVQALSDLDTLEIMNSSPKDGEESTLQSYTRENLQKEIRAGRFPVALVIPTGFEKEVYGKLGPSVKPVDLYFDASNAAAKYTVAALIKQAAHRLAPDLIVLRLLDPFEAMGAGITPQQRQLIETNARFLRQRNAKTRDRNDKTARNKFLTRLRSNEPFPTQFIDVREKKQSLVAYYAASIAVMFMLFTMAGAGGALLGEEEVGTLDRLLNSNVSMATLLTSYWLYSVSLGVFQILLMFLWAHFVFELPLFSLNRLVGFGLMSIFTASAAAGIGLLLGTICKTRAQLSGISTLFILIMSALGGSMIPRFLMSEFMETVAMCTFNGWAIEGFLQVFWYDEQRDSLLASISKLGPALLALATMSFFSFFASLHFARRRESV